MPIKILIVLTVLINFGIHFNQGEVIRGVNIKRINLTPILGKWYLLASSKIADLNLCVVSTVEELTGDNFYISVTVASKIKPENKNNFILGAGMRNDSNVIYTTKSDGQPGLLMVMLNLGYDSHVGLYVADTLSAITAGRLGSIYVIGRDKTLPDGILDDVKDTIFYHDGINTFDGVYAVNANPCPL